MARRLNMAGDYVPLPSPLADTQEYFPRIIHSVPYVCEAVCRHALRQGHHLSPFFVTGGTLTAIEDMNKSFYIGLIGLFLLGACGTKSASHDEHGHEHHSEASHNHNHEGDEHEGHDHEHEGHNHEHEGHNHEHEEQGHEHEGHGGGDEIILSPAKAKAAGVEVTEVQPTTFHSVIRTSGEIMAAQGDESVVVATIAGVAKFSHPLTEGMSVNKGQPLLSLSAGHLQEGDPTQKAKVNYETALKEYERMKRLRESQIVSARELEQTWQTYENARIAYEATATHAVGGSGQQVVSPLGGYVKNLWVKEGDYVAVGQPLATISQNRRLYLRAYLPEHHYASLTSIGSANFRTTSGKKVHALADLGGRLLSYGKASGNTGQGYLPVTFEFDNRGDIVPGCYAEVWLLSTPIEQALVLPKSALTEEQGSHFVYQQVDEEGYQKLLVETGADDGEKVHIIKGIVPGQRIVTRGANQVKLAAASNAIPAHSHEH